MTWERQNTDYDKVVLHAHSKYIAVVHCLVSEVKLAPGEAVLGSSSENGTHGQLLTHGLQDCHYSTL